MAQLLSARGAGDIVSSRTSKPCSPARRLERSSAGIQRRLSSRYCVDILSMATIGPNSGSTHRAQSHMKDVCRRHSSGETKMIEKMHAFETVRRWVVPPHTGRDRHSSQRNFAKRVVYRHPLAVALLVAATLRTKPCPRDNDDTPAPRIRGSSQERGKTLRTAWAQRAYSESMRFSPTPT